MRFKLIQKPNIQRNIMTADAKDLQNLDDMENGMKVDLYLTPEECQDYKVDSITHEVHVNVRSITINNIGYHLKPGHNKVPRPVYEAYIQSVDDRTKGYTCFGSTENIKQAGKRGMGVLY